MTRIIAMANQKGGAGKTTCAVNVACGWARKLPEGRVLLVDADPQANATAVTMGIEFAAGPRLEGVDVLYEVMMGEAKARDVIRTIELEESGQYPAAILHILPSHLQLTVVERKLFGEFQAESRLLTAMAEIVDMYDVIIIDCPPSLGLLTLNALMVADEVIIPVDPGLFPLIGLQLLGETINMVQSANPRLRISGVIPVMTDRTVLARDTLSQLAESFEGLILPDIPRRVIIGEAHSERKDIFSFAPGSDSAAAFDALIEEVMHRV